MTCEDCVSCPNSKCQEEIRILATITVTKDLETNRFIYRSFEYECKECGETWIKEIDTP